MKKVITVLILSCLLVISCSPGQVFGPTIVPSLTNTPPSTSTNTVAPTLTPTLTITPTLAPQTQTSTAMPFPNLEVKVSEAVDRMNILNNVTFVDIPDIEGQSAQMAEMPKDFTTITFIGEPYLTKAELRIDLSKLKDIDILNVYIISFIMATSTDGGFEAQDWARHSLSEAVKKGKIEKTFGRSKIVIEIEDSRFLNITVVPADNL